jgi:hypothetical protein
VRYVRLMQIPLRIKEQASAGAGLWIIRARCDRRSGDSNSAESRCALPATGTTTAARRDPQRANSHPTASSNPGPSKNQAQFRALHVTVPEVPAYDRARLTSKT